MSNIEPIREYDNKSNLIHVKESDTPRTDANVINVDYETREPDGEPSQVIEEVVLVEFARQLERELAAAIKELHELQEQLRGGAELPNEKEGDAT